MTYDDKKELAKRLLQNNPDSSSLQAQFKRINAAIELFNNRWNIDALEKTLDSTNHKIINDKNRAKRLTSLEG